MEALIFAFAWLAIFDCAYHDFTKKEIPDLSSATVWVALIFACEVVSSQLGVVGAYAFAFVFGLNSSLAAIKAPVLSWGDILLIPPVVGLMSYAPWSLLVLLLTLLIAALRSYKREEPLAPYILAAYSVFMVAVWFRA